LVRTLNRREFLRRGGQLGTQVVVGSSLFSLGCDVSFFGPLQPPDPNGIRLPHGFHSRVLARSDDPVGDTGFVWPHAPDGGATFETHDGWIYVANSELNVGGGASALRFDRSGAVSDAYRICENTRRNCAGGAMPWGSWLSCEEVRNGLVYECDPTGQRPQIARPALGSFQHEAVAIDPEGRLYLTEDEFDGALYRFTPNERERLESGLLEVAEIFDADRVRWHPVPFPNPAFLVPPTRRQVLQSTSFRGGEGIVYDRGHVYFTTKFDNRVWGLDLSRETIRVVYDRATDPLQQLSGVDNVTVTSGGDLLVAEDGGNMELVMLTPDGLALALLRVEGQPGSELTGPAFDPKGKRLYFSSQRGSDGRGITYEVRGPFESMRRRSLSA
jgi:secreted PhoX family phosphatase